MMDCELNYNKNCGFEGTVIEEGSDYDFPQVLVKPTVEKLGMVKGIDDNGYPEL